MALAEAGDPRFQAKPVDGAKGVKVILPEMVKSRRGCSAWAPASRTKSASKSRGRKTWDDEEPAHIVRLSAFRIGKYLLTNAEFRCFLDEHGYDQQDLWSVEGWKWRTGQWDLDLSVYSEDVREDVRRRLARRPVERRSQPFFWDDPQWNAANLPVVGVSWFEAEAYCNWLKALTGKNYRLPAEAQWEKAARGDDGRLWSWGDDWDTERCNSGEAGDALVPPLLWVCTRMAPAPAVHRIWAMSWNGVRIGLTMRNTSAVRMCRWSIRLDQRRAESACCAAARGASIGTSSVRLPVLVRAGLLRRRYRFSSGVLPYLIF